MLSVEIQQSMLLKGKEEKVQLKQKATQDARMISSTKTVQGNGSEVRNEGDGRRYFRESQFKM